MYKFFSKEINIIKNYPILLITLSISFFLLILFTLLWPIFRIRFGLINCDRIGHFSANTELYLCNRLISKSYYFDIFYYPKSPVNQQLSIMVKRKLIILPKFFIRPLDLISRKLSIFKRHRAITSLSGDHDANNLLDKIPSQITMNKEELNLGYKLLKSIFGLKAKKKFICLIVRDDAYLEKQWLNKGTMNFHTHRNIDINNFYYAANELTKKGYYVFRMGSKVNKKFNTYNNKMIIDYANSNFRTDFMDIFLMSNCFFCISTVTGLDAVSLMARKPILYLSSIPIGYYTTSSKKFMNCTRNHFYVKKNRNLKTSEIFKNSLAFSLDKRDFEKKKVILKNYTSKDIYNIAIEMLSYVKNNFKLNSKQKILNKKYWDNYNFLFRKYNKFNYHLHGNYDSVYSSYFLRNNYHHLK